MSGLSRNLPASLARYGPGSLSPDGSRVSIESVNAVTACFGCFARWVASYTRVQHPTQGSGASSLDSSSAGSSSARAMFSETSNERSNARTASHAKRIAFSLLRRASPQCALTEPPLDIVEDHLLEVGSDGGPPQGDGLLAVDEHGRGRCLTGAGKRDADIGVLRLSRSIDDAAHHRDVQRLDAGIAALPLRHLVADEILNVAGKLLEGGRGGAPAAGTRGDERHEAPETHALQQLLRDFDLERAVAIWLRRERDADGVADPLLQQHRERRGRGDDALRAHARLSEAEVERKVRARREH